jgi:hypothetical protein
MMVQMGDLVQASDMRAMTLMVQTAPLDRLLLVF